MIEAEIGTYLAAQGRGTLATNIFYVSLPPTPDNAICIWRYDTDPTWCLGSVHAYDDVKFSILVRNTSRNTALTLCESIISDLDDHSGTLSSKEYYSIYLNSGPIYLGDEQSVSSVTRYLFSINFIATKER